MRILTRYILGEILSHTLIGCALFTFILFMPYLPHVLEMVVRNSSTFSSAAEIFLFTLPNLFRVTIPMSVLVGVLLGLSRLASDSEIIAMRASGLGIWLFCAGGFYRCHRGHAAWHGQFALSGSAGKPGDSRHGAGAGDFAGVLPDSAPRLLRRLQELCSLRAECAFRNRRIQLGPGLHGRRQRSHGATYHHGRFGHSRQRFHPGFADAPAQRAQHDTVPDQPEQYNISSFTTTDRPLELNGQSDVHLGRMDTAIYAMPLGALLERITGPDSKAYSDRTPQPLRLSCGLPGADVGRCSAGR